MTSKITVTNLHSLQKQQIAVEIILSIPAIPRLTGFRSYLV